MNDMKADRHRFRMRWFLLLFVWLVAGRVCAAGVGPVQAAPRFLVDVWSADQGLPNSSVTSLAQTPDGYLWVGTHKGGLVRFDGTNFVRPTHLASPALPGREITMIEVDDNGTLWVEQEGPYRLISCRDGRFTNRFQTEPLTPVHFNDIVASFKNEVFFTTTNGQLIRIGTLPGAPEMEPVKLPFRATPGLGCQDAKGRLWLRSNAGGIGFLDQDKFVMQPAGPDGPGAPVNTLARGPDGRLWVGSNEGLAVLEGDTFRRIIPEGLPKVPQVLQISFSGDGGMWVRTPTRIMKELNGRWVVNVEPWEGRVGKFNGTTFPLHGDASGGAWLPEAGRGLWHVDSEGRLASIGTAEGLPGNLVTAWLQDSEGGIWVGTPGGLARLRPQLFEVVGQAQGLNQPVVRSIAEDGYGQIWLGAAGGLTRWSDGRCEAFLLPSPSDGTPLTDAVVSGVPGGRKDLLWVATVGGGAFQWMDDKPVKPFPPKSVGVAVRAILMDQEGGSWFGGEFGLYRWDGETLHHFGKAEGLNPGHIFDIREGANGDIWLANAGANLSRYRDGHFENWRTTELDDLLVHAILPDGDDTVWIGTLGGGLLRWRDGKFFRYTSEQGLPSDSVSQLLDDGLGFLWGGTRQGIFRVSKQALHDVADGRSKDAAFNLYGREDGLPSNECSGGAQPAALRASDGRLWFSTVRGAVAVDPNAVKAHHFSAQVRIEEVRVDGVAQQGNSVRTGDPMDLPPGRHTLEFRFSALTLAAPEKVRFRWRMSGVDQGWIDGGFQRSVSYGGMQPGDYQFEVRACNQDGVWNKNGASFRFSVEPRIWERRSFQMGTGVMSVFAAAGIAAAIQRRKYRKRVARLEARRALESERTRIARDLHDDLGAGLAQINISSGLVATEGIDPAVVPPLLQGIGTRSRELITALDEIVWAINPKNDTLQSLATYFCQYAKNFLNPAQIACRLLVDPGLPDLPLDAELRHGLFLAFAEALHNAVSHSGAGEVRVSIRLEGGRLHVSVADNGTGLPAETPAAGADGLINMRERLAQLGGNCQILNPPEGGTEVAFILPLRNPRKKP